MHNFFYTGRYNNIVIYNIEYIIITSYNYIIIYKDMCECDVFLTKISSNCHNNPSETKEISKIDRLHSGSFLECNKL